MAAKRKYQHTFRVPSDEGQPLRYWQATVELNPHPNGDRRRKFIRSKDRNKAERLYAQAIKDKEASGGDMPTRSLTVAEWMDEWFNTIHSQRIKPKTASTYLGLIKREILPAIGGIRLERLSTRDVRDMLNGMTTRTQPKAVSSTTAMQVHRILAVALKAAMVDGHIPRNVAALTKAPLPAKPQLTALTAAQGRTVLDTAADDKWRSLWWAVLHTGARQGELLGLQIDRVGQVIDLSRQLQRLSWEHGCNPSCGRKRGSDCPQRKITAPANWDAQHLIGGFWLTTPKSSKSTRIIPLVSPLREEIQRHLDATANMPNPFNLVWRMENGNPIDPRIQSEAWHALLKRAEVPDVRLHDGRHTAVDLLYESGTSEDEIQNIVGHSVRSTTRGYKSNVDLTRRTIAMQKLAAQLTPTPPDTPVIVVSSQAALGR